MCDRVLMLPIHGAGTSRRWMEHREGYHGQTDAPLMIGSIKRVVHHADVRAQLLRISPLLSLPLQT